MRKIILFLIFVLSFSKIFAGDFYPVKLIYIDGKVDSGLAQEFRKIQDKTIIFKSGEKSEEVKISANDLKTIIYYSGDKVFVYDRLKTFKYFTRKFMTPPVWLKVIKRGYVTLYYAEVGGGFSLTGAYEPPDEYWYCHKEGEKAASAISWNFQGRLNPNETFRREARKYFKDYSDLAKKIRNRKYKWNDIIEVVDIYNEWTKTKEEFKNRF